MPLQPEELKLLEQPSREEVEALLRQDVLRGYRIDIESDSTIRGDLGRNQQQMGLFLQGTAQFGAAMGPLVEAKAMPAEVAIEIYSAFARQFKLGKQAEDALDAWGDKARKAAEKPQPEKPDPNVVKAEVQQKLGEQKIAQADRKAQIDERAAVRDEQISQAEHQRDLTKIGAEMQHDQAKVGIEQQRLAIDMERAAIKRQGTFGEGPQSSGGQ